MRCDDPAEAAHQHLAALQAEGELLFDLLGQPLVVIVQEGDPVALRMIGPEIARRGRIHRTGIEDHPQPRILNRAQRRDGLLARPVEHHNDV